MSVYLMGLIKDLDRKDFDFVMIRSHFISGTAFVVFAIAGDRIFTEILQVQFSSFLIFGGLVFLLIGIRSIFSGKVALIETRGTPEHLVGKVSLPFMIAPGTLSASVLIGTKVSAFKASLAVLIAVGFSLISLLLLKRIYDPLRTRHEKLLNRYMEIAGRVVALFTGTFAIDMIARGVSGLIKIHS